MDIYSLQKMKKAKEILKNKKDFIGEIIVVDNGSTDNTIPVAQCAGARVVKEEVRGYGAACLKGIASADNPDVIVFLDDISNCLQFFLTLPMQQRQT